MKCRCGAQFDKGALFCPSCGRDLSSNITAYLLLFTAAGLAAIGYCGYFVLTGEKPPSWAEKPVAKLGDTFPAARYLFRKPELAPKPVVEKKRSQTEDMALVMAGTYALGAPSADEAGDADNPSHRVYLDAFFIDRFEVTAAKYLDFCAKTNRGPPQLPAWSQNDHPVVGVDWASADAYCRWAGKRLPTEAEWEAAATPEPCPGNDDASLGQWAWFSGNSGRQTQPVGKKQPNKLGIHDMQGNAWEWVWDFYDSSTSGADGQSNPRGPASGSEHVVRGGSWRHDAADCGCRVRKVSAQSSAAHQTIGFRCAVSADQVKS